MQLMMLFIVVVFILFICVVFIQKPLYQQIGSTCGFYAFVYAISRVTMTNFDKKENVRRIIKESIECGDSYVGEIFDINIMEKIIRKHYPCINVRVVSIKNIKDLDTYLVNNYVIYPCILNKVPHYVFLEKEKKSRYLYRHMYFIKPRKKEKEKFFQCHQNLKNVLSYEWIDYYDEKKGFMLSICSVVGDYLQRVSDCELYKLLKKNKEEKRNKLYGTNTKINMFGKILIISKE